MDKLGTKPAMLANLYLAKTIHKYYPLVTTDTLNVNAHLLTDHRAPPSIIVNTSRYHILTVLFTSSFNINFLHQLNIWISTATLVSTHPPWPSTMLLVIFTVCMAWIGNAHMQHCDGASFVCLIMIPHSLSLIPIFLE